VSQPESHLVRKIRAYLEGLNVWVFKVHGGDNPFQEVGIPDLLCCWQGRFVGLEVKLPGEKPSPKQRHVMKAIQEAGGIAEVVTSVDDVVKIFERTSRR